MVEVYFKDFKRTGESYLIKCGEGYYTEHASYEKDQFGKYKEFGARIVLDPSKHCMIEVSESMKDTDYAKSLLKKIEDSGFTSPTFVKFYKGTCSVLVEA